MNNRIPVLMYHAVHPQASVITTPPEVFARQMTGIKDKGYQVISLSGLAKYLHTREGLPERAIVLTFDDGFECLYEFVFPVLVQMEFSATIFLVSNHVGGKNNWAGQPSGIPNLPTLTWDQIIEMRKAGFEFGAHTMNHPRLDQTSLIDIEREIIGSKQMIEERLGTPISSFAYPYGRITPRIKEIVRRRFKTACSTKLGVVTSRSDPYELERIEMFYFQSLHLFEGLFSPWIGAYIGGRRILRSVRATLNS
jgi:peptidoglycan/xylan/chitin deacetylase (PgdA/CDA1 family)